MESKIEPKQPDSEGKETLPKPQQKRRPKPPRFGGEISEEDQLKLPKWHRAGMNEQVPNVTIQEQAALHPNFLGTRCYLDMELDQVYPHLPPNKKEMANSEIRT
jgi:hypothetical protein